MADPYNFGMGANLPTLATNPYLNGNPYLQQQIDAASGDMVKNFNLTALPASNAALVRSGSFGNSGLQELQQQDANVLQKNLGNLSNTARFNDYTNRQQEYNYQQGQDQQNQQFGLNFGRSLNNDAYTQNMGNLQAGIGLLGTLGSTNANDISSTTTQQNAPLNYYQQFATTANGLGGNGQTSTSTQGTTSNPLATALGGAQLGSKIFGSGSGSSSGGWNWGGTDSTGYNSGTGTWWA
ncbi:hypothetical protein [Variovorax sp. PBL-E5]|uniref:hypothetical protein n=1 Tax=Variovorax sp. PBL-E5 TaxID=434014 RepID=UPI001315CEC5|nr:hypothetical protein [Variovorax sp. PBL-E5]VTU37014.1 hypothetical protein E5CHR_04462 [Variovorax sp. PBL-E5]